MRFFWNSVGVEGNPKSKVEVSVGMETASSDFVRVWAGSGACGARGGGGKESERVFVCCCGGDEVWVLPGGAGKSVGW